MSRSVRTGITPAEALRTILEHTPVLGSETIGLQEALGRVLAVGAAGSQVLID